MGARAARGDDSRPGQDDLCPSLVGLRYRERPADGYLQYSVHKKEAAQLRRRLHIYTLAGRRPAVASLLTRTFLALENATGVDPVCHLRDLDGLFDDRDRILLEDQQPARPRTGGEHVLARLIGSQAERRRSLFRKMALSLRHTAAAPRAKFGSVGTQHVDS